jgi:hypothetical protein
VSVTLYDPAEHRPLRGSAWTDAGARDAIAEIADDAVNAYRGPTGLWPNHPADVEDDATDRSYRNVYFGAAGVAWALDRIAGAGLARALPGLEQLTASLHDDYLETPELTELETGTPPPPPSLLFGETGILLAVESMAPGAQARRLDALHAVIAGNARNPARELCWGSPGTLLAAGALWRHTGQTRWREQWREGAAWLCDEWRERVWVQQLYGDTRRYVGAGHGFAGNASVLLADAELLGDRPAVTARIAETAASPIGRSPAGPCSGATARRGSSPHSPGCPPTRKSTRCLAPAASSPGGRGHCARARACATAAPAMRWRCSSSPTAPVRSAGSRAPLPLRSMRRATCAPGGPATDAGAIHCSPAMSASRWCSQRV